MHKMAPAEYASLAARLRLAGYGEELDWAAAIAPPGSAEEFFWEYAHVVVNSGMKAQIAAGILARIRLALGAGKPVGSAYGHGAKARALETAREERATRFQAFQATGNDQERLAYLRTLPFLGPITVWHMAKNCGVACVKPDRHLVRIAAEYGRSPQELGAALQAATGDPLALIDTVLWRAANLGWR